MTDATMQFMDLLEAMGKLPGQRDKSEQSVSLYRPGERVIFKGKYHGALRERGLSPTTEPRWWIDWDDGAKPPHPQYETELEREDSK